MSATLLLSLGLLLGCSGKGAGDEDDDSSSDGGAADGGASDGGASDGGTDSDGGSGDGGEDPGEPSLVFELASDSTTAGEAVTYTLALSWPDGSEEDIAGELASDLEAAMAWDAASVTATVAGEHSITATYEELSATAGLSVQAGPAATLELVVDPTAGLDPDDSATATTTAADAHGNPVDGDVLLSTDPGTVEIDGDELTFLVDGAYLVTAELDGLTDTVGPIVVDSTGPALVLDQPERGTFAAPGTLIVSGTVVDALSDLDSLVIDGETVAVDAHGAFSLDLEIEQGVFQLESVATDSDGNETLDLRSVLAADYLADGDALQEGLVVRLYEGEGGLDVLGDLVMGDYDEATIFALLPDPLVYQYDETCWGSYCLAYEVEMVATDLRYESLDVILDPVDGMVDVDLVITGLEIDWTGTGSSLGSGISGSGTMTADTVTASLSLGIEVSSDGMVVTTSGVSVDVENLHSGVGSTLESLLTVLGVDFEATAEEQLTAALEDIAENDIAPAVEDVLASTQLDTELALGETTVSLLGTIEDVAIDDEAVTLVLETTVIMEDWLLSREGPGSPVFDSVLDDMPGVTGVELAANLDLVGQLAYAAWGADVLTMEASAEELGLDGSKLALLLPGVDEPIVVVDPYLPPVLLPDDGGESVSLHLGDLRLALLDGTDATLAYDMYIAAVVPIELTLDSGVITPTLGEPEVRVDVVAVPEGMSESDMEAGLEVLLPLLLDDLTGLVFELPLPSLSGMSVEDPTLELDEGADYLLIAGDLAVE